MNLQKFCVGFSELATFGYGSPIQLEKKYSEVCVRVFRDPNRAGFIWEAYPYFMSPWYIQATHDVTGLRLFVSGPVWAVVPLAE